MADAPHLTAGQAAALVGGELLGDPETAITGITSLDRAARSDLSVVTSDRHLRPYETSHAGVAIIPKTLRDHPTSVPTRIVVGTSDDTVTALIGIAEKLVPVPEPAWGIAPSARIGRNVRWSGRIAIAAGAEIGAGVTFGKGCVIDAHSSIGPGVCFGDDCHVSTNVSIEGGAEIGNRVVIKPGAVIGSTGYAYHQVGPDHIRTPHLGPCRIGDDVDIGANSTIDRGSLGETVVGAGTKIDNLVQIAHNVRIGKRCLIMAQVGVGGSAVVEDDVWLAGQAGLADHGHVERAARVAAQGGVIGRVPAETTVSGYPARDHRKVLRQVATLQRLAPLLADLERLAKQE